MSDGVRHLITPPFLTKFEKARILGARAQQLAMGAPPNVNITTAAGALDPLVVAREELKQKKIPMIVRRKLPDGSHEDWPLRDLEVL
ncbi:DNA-directed RNA polymerase II RPB6 [Spironucleus salmonicida]|uniref:DNA-directed RNA polymerase II RPB6 n=1 Tax=Spironucleus salmonicida TaxID=348837 RepID=V6LDH9_9EUKA|nr:DNA-directed RNA polymerase II RPB6 [Spironucleus salmonicida]|eukprot:EST41721.1 DNA-directed RNA polymerase II RPB6 [Spironucleus salmonicida]